MLHPTANPSPCGARSPNVQVSIAWLPVNCHAPALTAPTTLPAEVLQAPVPPSLPMRDSIQHELARSLPSPHALPIAPIHIHESSRVSRAVVPLLPVRFVATSSYR